jgi:hypothetical protein
VTTQPLVDPPAGAPSTAASAVWSPLTLIGFRIAVIYFLCFVFISRDGTIFGLFPHVGRWIGIVLLWLPDHASVWVGQHVFHLTGLAAHWQPTGSGDSSLNWIEAGLYLAVALIGGLVWSLFVEFRRQPRTEYATLLAWLRFLLRLTCAYFMLLYGFSKVFPLQMPPISIGILNEPVGNMSPMTMLWSLIGLHPLYEMICGLAEVIGGVLLLFRRTALLGALVSAFLTATIVLYNFFFDVPAKIFAANLLLGCLFLALPDARALFRFFWTHQSAAPSAVWFPPASRRWYLITLRIVEIVFTFGFLIYCPIFMGRNWRQTEIVSHTYSPLLGAWMLDAVHPATGAFIDGHGTPATDLYIDTVQRAYTRSVDGVLWGLRVDAKADTLQVFPFGRPPMRYSWQLPDPDHLILTTVPPPAPKIR